MNYSDMKNKRISWNQLS